MYVAYRNVVKVTSRFSATGWDRVDQKNSNMIKDNYKQKVKIEDIKFLMKWNDLYKFFFSFIK